jgi:hypothetical protein
MGLSGKDALRMSASSKHRTLAPNRFAATLVASGELAVSEAKKYPDIKILDTYYSQETPEDAAPTHGKSRI